MSVPMTEQPKHGAPPGYETQYGQPGAPPPGHYGQPGAPPPGHYGQPGAPPPVYGAPPQGGAPPGQVPWMTRPEVIPGCPPGLEYLTQVDQIVVKQIIEMLELFTGWETQNKYRLLNSMGQQVYYAAEESDLCMRQCCGPARGFVIHITDNAGQEIMRVTREFKCCAGCCWCANSDGCAFELTVEAPPGQPIGKVRQEQSSWKPSFSIRDLQNNVVAYIEGPCCVCNAPCCGDVEFPVLGQDGTTQIGKIAKQWTGALSEYFTDADTFSVSFPQDMDVRMKATFLGAVFLIDFMYFEKKQN